MNKRPRASLRSSLPIITGTKKKTREKSNQETGIPESPSRVGKGRRGEAEARWGRPNPCRRPPYTNSPSRCGDPHPEITLLRGPVCIFSFFSDFFSQKDNFGVYSWSRIATARKWAWKPTRGRSSLLLTSPPNGTLSFPDSWKNLFLVFSWFGRCWDGFDVLDAVSGFTETNYTQLTELYQKYRDKGLFFACCGSWSVVAPEMWISLEVGA